MFRFLTEDSAYLDGLLIVGALLCLIGLKVTREVKYLTWALTALGLAVVAFTIDQLWVTDYERIEQVVYDLRTAVASCDVQGVFKHLTADVEYVQGGISLVGDPTRQLIRANLSNATFDAIYIQGLQITAGQQTRRGPGPAPTKALLRQGLSAGSHRSNHSCDVS